MTRILTRWIVMSVLALTAVSGLTFLFWSRPLEVDTATVERGPIAETASDQGAARVRRTYVVSAPVSGRLDRLPLEVGDRVVANETVAAFIRPASPEFLDPRSRAQADAAVQAAHASLAAAVAQRGRLAAEVTRTSERLQRAEGLERQGVVAKQELDDARADAEAAANALRAAEADIANRQANLASARLMLSTPRPSGSQSVRVTSPASGIVTRLLQQSERTVAVGTQLVEVGDTSGLEAAIEFLSQDAVRIRPGMRAEIFNWGGPSDIPAEVRRVEPQGFTKVSALGVEEQRTLVVLQFRGDSECWEGLAPGYRVWGRVYLREVPSAVLAPIGALVRDRGAWAAYRIEGGRARLHPITVGTMTDRYVEVLKGVAPGDSLIMFPSDQVSDGVRVRPRT
jgi:HlyD family secretion protein